MTDIKELLDRLTIMDDRVVRKLLGLMVEYHMSLAQILAQVLAVGHYQTGDIFAGSATPTVPYAGVEERFETALDRYIEIAGMN